MSGGVVTAYLDDVPTPSLDSDAKPEKGGTNGHEELYVVLSGAARFAVGDEEIGRLVAPPAD